MLFQFQIIDERRKLILKNINSLVVDSWFYIKKTKPNLTTPHQTIPIKIKPDNHSPLTHFTQLKRINNLLTHIWLRMQIRGWWGRNLYMADTVHQYRRILTIIWVMDGWNSNYSPKVLASCRIRLFLISWHLSSWARALCWTSSGEPGGWAGRQAAGPPSPSPSPSGGRALGSGGPGGPGITCMKTSKFINSKGQWLLVGIALLLTCYSVHSCHFTKSRLT